MGAFTGANYDSVRWLNKDLLDKEQEPYKAKDYLKAAEVHHQKDIHLLRQEHKEKHKQLKKTMDHVKHQLENSELLNQ